MCANSVCEKRKSEGGMTAVAHAQEMTRAMVARECRGSGDMDNAMRRIEARCGIPHSTLWARKTENK